MTNFEDVLQQYDPMISAFIRKLHIYREHETYKQAGRVALWQAWERFDESIGNFTPFAYISIRGAMLDELKKEKRFEQRVTQMEAGLMENAIEGELNYHFEKSMFLQKRWTFVSCGEGLAQMDFH